MKLWGGLQVMHLTHGFSLILLGRLVLYEGAPCSLWEFKETNSRPHLDKCLWDLHHLTEFGLDLSPKFTQIPHFRSWFRSSNHWSFKMGSQSHFQSLPRLVVCHFSGRLGVDVTSASGASKTADEKACSNWMPFTRSFRPGADIFCYINELWIICIVCWCWLQYTCILYVIIL